MENNLTLFRIVKEKDLQSLAMSDDLQHSVPQFTILHPNLKRLIDMLPEDERIWVARVTCSAHQVIEGEDGFYRANEKIPVPEGFIPLEQALIKYSGIKLDA